MDFNLAGRTAMVTGGSKGIGLAVVRSSSQDPPMTIRGPKAVEDGRYTGLGVLTIHRSSSPQQAPGQARTPQ
jgi:hypothetical protein